MTSPLEGKISKIVGKALKATFYAAKITRETPGDGPAYDPGPSTYVDYPCRGMVDSYNDFVIDGTRIQTGDVKTVILTDTLSITPTTADTATIRGKTYSIVNVSADPAQATWVVQGRS